jgi:hypothetical protein
LKIILLGTTGVHHCLVLARHFFCQTDSSNREIQLSDFGDTGLDRDGCPVYLGSDRAGNEFYSLGMGRHIDMARKSIEQLREILGFSGKDLMVCPVRIRGEYLLYFLEKISGWPGMQKPGRHLAWFLIRLQWQRLMNEATHLQEVLKQA